MTTPVAGTCSYIATHLDAHFLEEARGVAILAPLIPDATLPSGRPGQEVADELAGRLLVRYLRTEQVPLFIGGSDRETYVTPTPYTPTEAVTWLNLPDPLDPRTHLLFLNPAKIRLIIGPLWVSRARGIQYILPHGFPQDAIVVPGAPGAAWATTVT